MKKGCFIALGLFILICCGLIYGFLHAFDPEYSKASIPQKVGGVLLCDATYISDHHSWYYDVIYKYKDKSGHISQIGDGRYFEREWQQDEQFVRQGKWWILKTGGRFDNDKIIVGNPDQGVWCTYDFTAENIVNNSLWKDLNINPLVGWLPEESFITRIANGQIDVLYKFRVDEKNADLLGKKKIIYQIDSISGQPIMMKVVDVSK